MNMSKSNKNMEQTFFNKNSRLNQLPEDIIIEIFLYLDNHHLYSLSLNQIRNLLSRKYEKIAIITSALEKDHTKNELIEIIYIQDIYKQLKYNPFCIYSFDKAIKFSYKSLK